MCNKPLPSGRARCRRCENKFNKYQTERLRKLREEGRCTVCAVKVETGRSRCGDCIADGHEYVVKRRLQLADKGICTFCGKEPQLDSLRTVAKQSRLGEVCYLKRKSYDFFGTNKYWEHIRLVLEEQGCKCSYTGQEIVLGENDSLDHVLPKKRFPDKRKDLDNIQWVTRRVNKMKDDMTEDEFLSLVALILNHSEF